MGCLRQPTADLREMGETTLVTALTLWLALVIGSGLGILTERSIQKNTLRQGETVTLKEGESLTLGRTTWTATKGTIRLSKNK